jgi:hypothetical protein
MIIFLVLLNLFHQNIFHINNSLGIVFSLLSFNYNLWRERKEIKKKKKDLATRAAKKHTSYLSPMTAHFTYYDYR